MWGRFVRLVLIGAAVSCVAPAGAVGVSSISVAVDAPVVSARIAVTVTMASDQVGTKRAYPLARVDDGRPCEPTWSAFTAATPPSQVRGLTESLAFAAGSTTVTVTRAFAPGAVRVCGYLEGPSAVTLATSDAVVVFRLPTATLSMTVTPERPAFNERLSVRVTGTSEIDAIVKVYPGAGGCPRDVSEGISESFVSQGPIDVTLADVSHPEATDRICLLAIPNTQIPAPNEALVLVSSEKPFSQDLGGSIRLVSANLYWRRIELVGEVTGTMPQSAFGWDIRLPGGGDVTRCQGQAAPQSGQFVRRRGSRVVVSFKLVMCRGTPKAILAGLYVETPFGARLATGLLPLDLSETVRRNGLLVPDRSISGVTIGMTQAALVRQNGAPLPEGGGTLGRVRIAPGFGRNRDLRGFSFEEVDVGIRGGRVVVMATTAESGTTYGHLPMRTSGGITPYTKAARGVALWRRAHPDARCVRPAALVVSACRLGRFTYVKPRPAKFPGFFAILPGRSPVGGLKGTYVPLR